MQVLCNYERIGSKLLNTMECKGINRHIESKVYFKPTDGYMYLLPQSSHHKSLYRNILFGVALRLRRKCSRDDWLEEQLQEFKHFFQCRRYNNNIINKGFKRAKNITHSDALYPNLAQMIVCRIWCWLWTTTQTLETFLNLSVTICPSYMSFHA